LSAAAEKAGGFSTGLFSYDNQTATIRLLLEALRNDPGAFEKLISFGGVPPSAIGGPDLKKIREWMDFSLLPPFERIAKYFYYTVTAGGATPDGIVLKAFAPTPPELKR
ncbi:MAG: hypothetical protein HY300_03600, partial [Verrucomicrobia bacterium]|nr:hypothetical protein [Verrucomicrobiota bacterium]